MRALNEQRFLFRLSMWDGFYAWWRLFRWPIGVCASERRTIYIQPPGARSGARGVLPSGESGELLIMAFELLL